MAPEGAQTGGGRLEEIMAALRLSADKTARYFLGTFIFYVVLIAVFIVLTATAKEPEARGANIGILILVSLGYLGMWISPLRGLKGSKVGISGFLNLFHLPLRDRIAELEDESAWGSPEERERRALEYLALQAAAEREMRAWPNRLLSLSVITVIDLLIWLLADAWLMAIINQCIAMVVSQTHISMAPTASVKALVSVEGRVEENG